MQGIVFSCCWCQSVFCIPVADGRIHFFSLQGTPVPKDLSKSSENVIVERLPNMVRKVTILKRLPERQPIPPPRERNIVVKSVKLSPESYLGPSCLSQHITGSKKRAKEHTSKTDSMYSIFIGSYFKSMFCPIWDIHIRQHFLGCDAMLVNGYQHIRGVFNLQFSPVFDTHLLNCMFSHSRGLQSVHFKFGFSHILIMWCVEYGDLN
jgi:hypothetical protein